MSEDKTWNKCKRGEKRCDLKSCYRCEWRRTRKQYKRYANRLCRSKTYWALILTVPANDLSPIGQCRQLVSQFKQLASSKAWNIVGGIRKLETSHDGKQWRSHLHVFVEPSPAFDGSAIQKEWTSIAKGLALIEQVRNADGRLGYDLKHAHHALHETPDRLHEFLRSTKGFRMLQGFGSWFARASRHSLSIGVAREAAVQPPQQPIEQRADRLAYTANQQQQRQRPQPKAKESTDIHSSFAWRDLEGRMSDLSAYADSSQAIRRFVGSAEHWRSQSDPTIGSSAATTAVPTAAIIPIDLLEQANTYNSAISAESITYEEPHEGFV